MPNILIDQKDNKNKRRSPSFGPEPKSQNSPKMQENGQIANPGLHLS